MVMSHQRAFVSIAGAIVVTAVLIPAPARGQSTPYTAPRNATVPAGGVRLVRISSGAGFLHVDGRNGIGQARVTGTARASNRRVLDGIRLVAERQGDVIVIKADMPDEDRGLWDMMRHDYVRLLDMDIDVPANIPIEVHDGSGDLLIRGTASAEVEDGSGNLEISGIGVSNVTGRFTIEADGSGNIDANGIGGTMRVSSDGSGNIMARRVGGDLVVESKGSGSIQYSTVKGSIDIPERHRRYRTSSNY
jgi:hypothetical protein